MTHLIAFRNLRRSCSRRYRHNNSLVHWALCESQHWCCCCLTTFRILEFDKQRKYSTTYFVCSRMSYTLHKQTPLLSPLRAHLNWKDGMQAPVLPTNTMPIMVVASWNQRSHVTHLVSKPSSSCRFCLNTSTAFECSKYVVRTAGLAMLIQVKLPFKSENRAW